LTLDLANFELPEVHLAPFSSASLQYGAGLVVSRYCRLSYRPEKINGYWEHGWLSHHRLVDPRVAFGVVDQKKQGGNCWVGTQIIANYLKKNGYSARAIGLPIAYVEPKSYERKKNSLLVMPAHSLDYTQHEWRFEEYVDAILSIRAEFALVTACIHPSCLKHGYWVKEFEKAGIPIIPGANANDLNALERVRALMSQFEFVTTNAYGSLLAYGGAFGAKVSIFGPYCSLRREDFTNAVFYQDQPGLIDKTVDLLNEKIVRSVYPDFFCHPIEAKQRVEWGLEQIGWSNRISPAEMRRCFGWEWYHEPLRKAKTYFHIGANKLLTRKMRTALDEWGSPQLKARNSELRRIESVAKGQSGRANLEGLSLHFQDPQRFLSEYRRIFLENALDVPCIKGSPVILDWGAGIGIPMRYWAKKFPTPEIHLFEPDDQMRETLAKNAAEATNAKLQIHENAGKLAELLDRSVDFLRMDLGLPAMELLKGVGDRIHAAERILLTCRTELGKEQQVSKVLRLLEDHGFRYHLSSRNASVNPLVELKSVHGADCVVDVWGYRGDKFPRTL
jgi:precorrin-6B methylase 2